ncbi:CD225/dispanin family protein [Lysobacter sp. cf310]|uniref:CD225/dispanin family protein n=1 Tax=Lysobacter sp. cf310 TaxID=1761790 RepID=UPI0008EE64CD|nr:CD225/dispanin family protein [Lysobacter sp. cf310]SFL30171.1 Interferon-induced transmembrane protein [Lysobacter sp. cf310]
MYEPPQAAPAQPIQNYLAWSISMTVLGFCLCCFIGCAPGIVGIVYGSQVNSKSNAGDLEGARKASENAKIWCWVATALVVVGLLLNIASFMMGGTAQYMEMMQQMQNAR